MTRYCKECQIHRKAKHPRTIFIVAGVQHAAPSMWMVGCAHSQEQDGASPVDALHAACLVWAEQCDLARVHRAQAGR